MPGDIGWNVNNLFFDYVLGEVDRQVYMEVIAALGDLDGKTIDEFGCGTGELTRLLSQTAEVRAIDYKKRALETTRKKTGLNVDLFLMNFYFQRPDSYKPDKVVACRSIYHPDLDLSLGILSKHLGDGGLAVVAHPVPYWLEYVTPNGNGKGVIDFKLMIKSISRPASRLGLLDYSLFTREQFLEVGQRHFNEVNCQRCGYGTHYLVMLRK